MMQPLKFLPIMLVAASVGLQCTPAQAACDFVCGTLIERVTGTLAGEKYLDGEMMTPEEVEAAYAGLSPYPSHIRPIYPDIFKEVDKALANHPLSAPSYGSGSSSSRGWNGGTAAW